MDNMDEFKTIFFTECAELLVDMESRLLELDEGTQDKEQLNAIFRCAHSIKGGAGAFGFSAIMQFTHVLEALLDSMREGKVLPSRDSIDALLKSVDVVNQMLVSAKQGQEPPAGFGSDLLTVLQSHASGAPAVVASQAAPVAASAAPQGEHSYEISFAPHEELFLTGNDPINILRELSRLGKLEITVNHERVPELPELNPLNCFMKWDAKLVSTATEEAVHEVFEFVAHISDLKITRTSATPAAIADSATEAATATPDVITHPLRRAEDQKPTAGGAPAATATSIRVDLEKIDKLVNMVGELVITEAMIKAQVRGLDDDAFAGLLKGVEELSHHTRELQEAVMAVRMQPVKSVFSRMPRIVRDTSGQLGKEIELILSGEETEVDKTVIESLGDPLTHMIRNSCDHGIEKPDVRVANGKPARGTVYLSAYHRSGRIIIEIKDDGAGINRERVLKKATEKGLVSAGVSLSDEEIDHLVFLPGFSTAEKVTSVSGRGVGMDVVKRNIEALGGNVRITNTPGKGSIFTVSLPLTLAILDGMIVRVGAESYIIPITSIIETMRPKMEQVHEVQGRSDVINVRGEFVPLVYLRDVFSIPNAEQDLSKALVVLVESGQEKMGLVVDELIGQQQVVIKSLEANADPVKGISGATILGDGKVSLILEISELKQLCQPAGPQLVKAA